LPFSTPDAVEAMDIVSSDSRVGTDGLGVGEKGERLERGVTEKGC